MIGLVCSVLLGGRGRSGEGEKRGREEGKVMVIMVTMVMMVMMVTLVTTVTLVTMVIIMVVIYTSRIPTLPPVHTPTPP